MLLSPKLAILQSLDAMDRVQMEEVLDYIKSIVHKPAKKMDYVTFKKEAMKEIKQALRQEKGKSKLSAAA